MNTPKNILTVTQLNRHVRSWLEHELGDVFVEGEVSTLTKPSSGHFYFTLKDCTAQIKCVFFRNRHHPKSSNLLQSGQQVVIFGQLSLYEARGDYQLIVEQIESAGQGDMYRQFEQLKQKLAKLGLFDAANKKSIPRFPKIIGIITSPTAAALRDILTTLRRRYPLAPVILYPSEVQGASAHLQLITAIQRANLENRCDVLILARGGGSIEDLWAFNHEQLAYALADSQIPIVCGVGHETDFTIADFVADLRAATPTAAAEAVSPSQFELLTLLENIYTRLNQAILRLIKQKHFLLQHQIEKLAAPKQLIQSHWQTVDFLRHHLVSKMQNQYARYQHHLQLLLTRLQANNPKLQILSHRHILQHLEFELNQRMRQLLEQKYQRFKTRLATLNAVSPLATLERGYAIATTQKNHVILNSGQVNIRDIVRVQLSKGQLKCEVIDHA